MLLLIMSKGIFIASDIRLLIDTLHAQYFMEGEHFERTESLNYFSGRGMRENE